jgi:hypothetical protein
MRQRSIIPVANDLNLIAGRDRGAIDGGGELDG